MKHVTRDEMAIRQLLERARTIAVIGASPRPARHSYTVCRWLHDQGYEVIPVRPDRAEVAGLTSYERLADVPGAVDLVVIFRARRFAPALVREAGEKRAESVWLQPGVWSRACDEEAARAGLTLVAESCIEEEAKHALRESGHPRKLGVHARRRGRTLRDDRKRPVESGYRAGGGGGHRGGGGMHAVLDEKKMVRGRPSPRQGVARPAKAVRLRGRQHGAR
jgi:predicted CoA-binding protein